MDWYTDAELLRIEAAGRLAVAALQQLRDRDEARREPYVSWDAVSAGHNPQYPTTEGTDHVQ
ncbi:hypothetical protein BH24ACT15_BH24ACT15_34930 [soil metagenome]